MLSISGIRRLCGEKKSQIMHEKISNYVDRKPGIMLDYVECFFKLL